MQKLYFTKFCGITNIDDALNAQKSGCDAIGFVFVQKSKRHISPVTCHNIIKHLSPTMLIVGLFADNSQIEIDKVLNQCHIHVLQFHGNESPEFCRQFNKPYWKAIPMADKIDPIEYANLYPDAQGYVIDNYGVNQLGGSGKSFSWNLLPKEIDCNWILAGGLTVNNIYLAKTETQFTCYDVSSGIEDFPGIKSITKMKHFLKNLNKNND